MKPVSEVANPGKVGDAAFTRGYLPQRKAAKMDAIS